MLHRIQCGTRTEISSRDDLLNRTLCCKTGYTFILKLIHNFYSLYFNFNQQLPDGRVIKLGGERFEAPEALFQPHLVNIEGQGIK